MPVPIPASAVESTLRRLAAERILVLDGAMGTMIQALGLDEEGYRGARFDAWNREVRGNNDLLILSQPAKIREIHLAYFRAGRVSLLAPSARPIAPLRSPPMSPTPVSEPSPSTSCAARMPSRSRGYSRAAPTSC